MNRTARVAGTVLTVAAASLVALAAPAAAEDCVTADGSEVVCLNVVVVPTPDTSNGATMTLLVDVDVCILGGDLLCRRESATLTLDSTGLRLNGVSLSSRQVGGVPVHVPQICFNSNPCVGPVDYTIPYVDAPCVTGGSPTAVIDGREFGLIEPNGTC